MKTKPKPWTSMSADERKLLVATTIFGWKAEKRKRYAGAENVEGWGLNQHLHRGDNDRHFVTDGFFLPAWPTSIESAFEVVEKLKTEWQFALAWMEHKGKWQAGFWKDHVRQVEAEADSPAEAIALAALRANGVEVE